MSKLDSNEKQFIDDSLEKTQAGYINARTQVMTHKESHHDQNKIKQSHPYPFLNPPKNHNDIGEIGHYQINEVLGQGGMGFVFKAHDSQLHRTIAIKVMKPELCSQANAKARFIHEARAMASIHSDNVAIIHQVGEQNDIPYLAMEFLQGQSMEQWIKSHPKTSAETIIKWGIQICEGLIPAHKKNLIHRDIKPANLWIESPEERIKILDFGLAYALDSDVQLTQTGYILGTLEYMSPEQIDSGTINARSDLFSLGCVLYQLASNSSPFSGSSQLSVLKNLATITPLPLQQIRSDIPISLSLLISQLLSKAPESRPASAEEVSLRLKKISQEQGAAQSNAAHQSKTSYQPNVTNNMHETQASKLTVKNSVLLVLIILVSVFFFKQGNFQTEQTQKEEVIIKTETNSIPSKTFVQENIDDTESDEEYEDSVNDTEQEPFQNSFKDIADADDFSTEELNNDNSGVEVVGQTAPEQVEFVPNKALYPPARKKDSQRPPPGAFPSHRPPPPPGGRPPPRR